MEFRKSLLPLRHNGHLRQRLTYGANTGSSMANFKILYGRGKYNADDENCLSGTYIVLKNTLNSPKRLIFNY